jgi:hypothetical protein
MRYRERADDWAVFEKGKLAEMFILERDAQERHPGAVDRSENDDVELTRKSHEISLRVEASDELRKGGNMKMRKCSKCGQYLRKDQGVTGTWAKIKNGPADYCEECRPSSPADGYASKVDSLGPRADSVFSVPDEAAGVGRKVPVDLNERRIREMENRISVLNTLIQTGQGQDVGAMVRERDRLVLQLSVLTRPAQYADRLGRPIPSNSGGLV